MNVLMPRSVGQENGTLSRDAENIALQQSIWAAHFRLYPMIGYGGNVTGLHSLWDGPEPFIEVVVADAVRHNWAGIVRACPLALPVAIGAKVLTMHVLAEY